MKLSVSDATTVLGQSKRQIRYSIRAGKLTATKVGKSWQIHSESLPLDDEVRLQLRERLLSAQEDLESVLEPVAKAVAEPTTESSEKKSKSERYSVRKLAAFETGRELWRKLEEHPCIEARENLFQCLVQLTQGCHTFNSGEKAKCFKEARLQAAAAVARLFLSTAPQCEALGERIEQELIPKIGDLVPAQEIGNPATEHTLWK